MPGREWCDFDIVGMEGIPEEFQATTKGPSFLPNEKEVLQACLMRKQQALQILNSFLLQGTIKSFADHENGNAWGFIIPSTGGNDLFVHEKEVIMPTDGEPIVLRPGQRVYYNTKEDRRYGTQAAEVRPIPDATTKNYDAAPHELAVAPVSAVPSQYGGMVAANAMLPRKQSTGPRMEGVVKSFSEMQKWGFIIADGGGPDIFAHISEIEPDPMNPTAEPMLSAGQRVTFHYEEHKGRPQAKNITGGGHPTSNLPQGWRQETVSPAPPPPRAPPPALLLPFAQADEPVVARTLRPGGLTTSTRKGSPTGAIPSWSPAPTTASASAASSLATSRTIARSGRRSSNSRILMLGWL